MTGIGRMPLLRSFGNQVMPTSQTFLIRSPISMRSVVEPYMVVGGVSNLGKLMGHGWSNTGTASKSDQWLFNWLMDTILVYLSIWTSTVVMVKHLTGFPVGAVPLPVQWKRSTRLARFFRLHGHIDGETASKRTESFAFARELSALGSILCLILPIENMPRPQLLIGSIQTLNKVCCLPRK